MIRSQGRCFLCTRIGHDARVCNSRFKTCKYCRGRHHAVICEQNRSHKPALEEKKQAVAEEATVKKINVTTVAGSQNMVVLQTAMALVSSPEETGSSKKIRCLLDNGSQATFIKEDISRELQLPIIGEQSIQIAEFMNDAPRSCTRRVVSVAVRNAREPNGVIHISAIEVPFLCTALTLINCNQVQDFARARNMNLADEPTDNTKNASNIDLLIGADQYYDFSKGRTEMIDRRLAATETTLGWVIHGPVNQNNASVSSNQVTVLRVSVTPANAADTMSRFWDIESLGIKDKPEADFNGQEVLERFEKETIFEDGRYQVKFPWNRPKEDLPNNLILATRRARCLVQRFKRDPILYHDYKAIIEDQLQQGIVEVVEPEENHPVGTYYLPHQGVRRESSSTTKLRVVMDGSASAKDQPSLNNCIAAGPNLNPDLLKLVLRFRTHRIAITADVEKAFLQVSLDKDERNSVRFLWVQEHQDRILDNEFQHLRMTRVPFGVTSSPFLLAATIKLHLKKQPEENREVTESLNEDLYVDDYVSGAEDVLKAYDLSVSATDILKGANMFLRKWKTNSAELREKWATKEMQPSNEALAIATKSDTEKILGLVWNPKLDEFLFDLSNIETTIQDAKPNKRHILSIVAKIYDPIGMLAPYVIRGKMLFQKIWKEKVTWDENLPQIIKDEFDNWHREMPAIRQIKLKRCYYPAEKVIRQELHTFCDASSKAYAATVYLRYVTESGKRGVSFVACKARVAPLDDLQLPRLELMPCLLGARLIRNVRSAFKIDVIEEYLWSDSMVALYWIKGNTKVWKPFVQNRLKEIVELTKPNDWKHCPGKENPADVPSRGAKAADLAESKLWWEGPHWLQEDSSYWPSDKIEVKATEIQTEVRKSVLVIQTETNNNKTGISSLMDLKNYNSINKVFRITAYLRRYSKALRKINKEYGPITAAEMGESEILWIASVQKIDFAQEIKALSDGATVRRGSKIARLRPILNHDGLLCVGGRLDQSRLTEEEKYPILHHKKQHLTLLLMTRSHWQVLHSGVQATLTQARGRYWAITGRQIAKNVVRNCMVCRREQAKPGEAPMAPLPLARVDYTPAFVTIGIDFAGPLYVKTGEEVTKAYICLFTCATTRAIHLELVPYQTTYEFLMAFRRLVSRRGVPHLVYSNNAKTFIRANEDLKQLWKSINDNATREFFGEKGITWRFIADRAAWWGGFWEKMVRSVKTILRKVLGRATLSYQEMETLLAETEAIINSRPMTFIFNEANEPTPLTPSHFLIGQRLTCMPPQRPKEAEIPTSQKEMSRRLKTREALKERLWKRWKEEYLMELRNAHQVLLKKTHREMTVGDVVIIHEEKVPKQMWKLAIITEVMKGRDGNTRSYLVRTPNGNIIRRPTSLLYALEVNKND